MDALTMAKESVNVVEQLWDNRFPDLVQQVTFMEDKATPYHRTIDLILKVNPKDKESQILEYIEKLKTHLLRNRENNPIYSKYSDSKSERLLQNIKERLSDKDALLELYYNNDYFITLLISKSSEPELVIIDKNIEELHYAIHNFENNIKCSDLNTSNAHIELGYYIYSQLISHEGRINPNDIKKIFIIPYGKLNLIPWNALSIKKENAGRDYLIDHYDMSVIPNAVSLLDFNNQHKKKIENVYFGSFFFVPEPNEDRSIIEEIKYYKSYQLYIDDDANVNTVKESLKNTMAVFLYAHGHFYANPLDSFIQLGGNSTESKLTLVQIEETNNITSNLVFLANCGSGIVSSYSERITKQSEESFEKDKNKQCNKEYNNTAKNGQEVEANELLGLYKVLFSKGVNHIVVSLSHMLSLPFVEVGRTLLPIS